MITHHNIRGYPKHKSELQAFLEDHSPDVVTLNETMSKGYNYKMPHYNSLTRDRTTGKGGGVAILLRNDIIYEEIDDIDLASDTDNEQLTVAIRLEGNKKLFISTIYCPHGEPSTELIDGLCGNGDQLVLTGDFNSKHPNLGNDQTNLMTVLNVTT